METKPTEFVTKIGNIEIPFYTFVEGPIKFRNIHINYKKTEPEQFREEIYFNGQKELAMTVPQDIADLRKYIVNKKLEENSKSSKPKVMSNGAQYGCTGITPNDSGDELEVIISLRDTRFFDHMGIAQALDVPFYNGTMTLREYKEIDSRDYYDFLPHACGNNVSIKSSDGYFIWMNRGDQNVQYPNMKGVPAGFGNRVKDLYNGKIHPAVTAAREGGEEAGAKIKIEDLLLMHVGTPYDDLHTEISWLYESNDMKADEMMKSTRPTSKYEGKLFKVPADLNDLTIKHLKNPSEWVQAHWYLTLQHLMKDYGRENIIRKLGE